MAPKDFFNKYANYAMDAQIKFGIPASITLAQAALESGWGESGLTKSANNFFGIKDQPNDEWYGAYVEKPTGEVFNGVKTTITSKFRKYADAGESFKDHASFLLKNKRYAPLFQLKETDYINWAKGLKAAGYATALNYADTLINMVYKYQLNKYDELASKKKRSSL